MKLQILGNDDGSGSYDLGSDGRVSNVELLGGEGLMAKLGPVLPIAVGLLIVYLIMRKKH